MLELYDCTVIRWQQALFVGSSRRCEACCPERLLCCAAVQEAAVYWGGAPPPPAEQRAKLRAAEQHVAQLHQQLAALDPDAHALPGPAAGTGLLAPGRPSAPATSLPQLPLPLAPSPVAHLLAADELALEDTLLPGSVPRGT